MENIFKHIQSIITIVSLLVTGIFWVFTMNGIPKRVEKLEIAVDEIKVQQIKNDTKVDTILEDTKFIKQLVMQKHI